MSRERIKLVVEDHGTPANRFSLVRYDPGQQMNVSLEKYDSDLLCCADAAKFYRAVARHMARMVADGEVFEYDD